MVIIKQGDLFPDIEAIVKDENGTIVDVTGATVTCSMRHSRDPALLVLDGDAAEVVSPGTNGKIRHVWASGETELDPGTYEAEFKVTPTVGDPFRVPTSGYIPVIVEERVGTDA